ncbi:MAG: hypothetical protein ABFR97_11485, partial [Thermodesulfobacteriota bacterium]
IIDGLVRLGVDEIELGVVSPENQDLGELTAYIRRHHPAQPFSLWCRCKDEDIRHAATLQPTILALSIPASDLHISKKLGKNRNWVTEKLRSSLKAAREAGFSKIGVGLEDASRADLDFIRKLAEIGVSGGAFRLRLADTVGIASPLDISRMLTALAGLKLELALHCHNDFGMATANSLTGLALGAKWADATILGLGERAGNSRLEELVSYLTLRKDHHYNLEALSPLSNYVASRASRKIGPARPILGAEIFTCETGLHLQGLMADPTTYEPFAPEKLGRKRIIKIGQKAGRRCIAATLVRLGLVVLDERNLTKITRHVRKKAASRQGALTDHEILTLAKPFCLSI